MQNDQEFNRNNFCAAEYSWLVTGLIYIHVQVITCTKSSTIFYNLYDRIAQVITCTEWLLNYVKVLTFKKSQLVQINKHLDNIGLLLLIVSTVAWPSGVWMIRNTLSDARASFWSAWFWNKNINMNVEVTKCVDNINNLQLLGDINLSRWVTQSWK